jgi:dephospho-CoA kinase
MRRIGLTGNIASGKSTVAAVWRRLGAVVIDADLLARAAIEPGTPGLHRVIETFGKEVLAADGSLDRARMRRLVFDDERARRQLESIIHPEVSRLRVRAEAEAAGAGAPVVVHDIPLLYETGLGAEFDAVVVVDASETERIRRLVELRGLPTAEAVAMVRAQMSAEEKVDKADLVLRNDDTIEELERKAAEAWHELKRRLAASG